MNSGNYGINTVVNNANFFRGEALRLAFDKWCVQAKRTVAKDDLNEMMEFCSRAASTAFAYEIGEIVDLTGFVGTICYGRVISYEAGGTNFDYTKILCEYCEHERVMRPIEIPANNPDICKAHIPEALLDFAKAEVRRESGDDCWVATFAIEEDGKVRSFGNVNGRAYATADEAWRVCLSACVELREAYRDAIDECCRADAHHIHLRITTTDEEYTYEVQRLHSKRTKEDGK